MYPSVVLNHHELTTSACHEECESESNDHRQNVVSTALVKSDM